MIRQIIKKVMDSYIAFECKLVIKSELHQKKRLLLMRKDALGDFIIFSPTLKLYREYYGDYEINLVINPLAADLIPALPFIDNYIVYNQKKFRTNFWYRRTFMHDLKKKGFDIAIYPVYSREPIGDLFIKITEAKEKITFKNNSTSRDIVYTSLIEIDPSLNEIERNMAFARKVTGLEKKLTFPTIDINLLAKSDIDLKNKKYCVMFPGAGATYRIWQLEKFSEIADYIISKGYKVVVCGTKEEAYLAEKIIEKIQNKNQTINLTGKTNISSLASILAGSAFYFGSETGVLHLACALGTPAVCILGGGDFGRFFPYGDLNRNLIVFDEKATCRNDNWKCSQRLPTGEIAPCIKNITTESAKKEINSLLEIL